MEAVVREFTGKGAKELFDVLEKHKADLHDLMRGIKGFVSYTLVRTDDGGYSITVCKSKAGITESIKRGKNWIAKNAGKTGAAAPRIITGSSITYA